MTEDVPPEMMNLEWNVSCANYEVYDVKCHHGSIGPEPCSLGVPFLFNVNKLFPLKLNGIIKKLYCRNVLKIRVEGHMMKGHANRN